MDIIYFGYALQDGAIYFSIEFDLVTINSNLKFKINIFANFSIAARLVQKNLPKLKQNLDYIYFGYVLYDGSVYFSFLDCLVTINSILKFKSKTIFSNFSIAATISKKTGQNWSMTRIM